MLSVLMTLFEFESRAREAEIGQITREGRDILT